MQKDSNLCFFYQDFDEHGTCGILSDTPCAGRKQDCTFFKTARQYYLDRNAAIQACRDKGLCNESCKYSSAPCEFLKVPGDINN